MYNVADLTKNNTKDTLVAFEDTVSIFAVIEK